jgi:predicted ribosomally synthesized peptide with nif11-like leader
MSQEQLAALIAKLQEDAGLREKLKGAVDLDAAVALAQEAGFDVSKADWMKYQARETLELSDEELEDVAGGGTGDVFLFLLSAGWYVGATLCEGPVPAGSET